MSSRLVHLDNAGMSLSPQPVLNTVMAHLAREQRMGGYRAEADQAERLAAGYGSVAELVGGKAQEIAFMHNATLAFDVALLSLGLAEGDRVILHRSSYASNRMALLRLRERGVVLDEVGSTADGNIDPDAVRAAVRDDTRLICATHVPSTHGRINPVARVGAVAREAGVPYLLDACQSAGQVALDVEAIGCTMLAATGRKFLRGPRGTGFLWVSESVMDRLEPLMPDYRSARLTEDGYRLADGAVRFENYEHNVAAKLGFIRAVDYALDVGPERIEARVRELSRVLQAALTEAGMKVLPDQESGIVVWSHPWLDATEVHGRLAERGVVTSVSRRFFDVPETAVRTSIHYYNTDAEVGRLVEELAEF